MIKAQTLQNLLASSADEPLVVAGGGTPLEALSAQLNNFPVFYLSGYAVAAWRHGLPDIGLLGARDIAAALRAVTRVSTLPVICDADTGYGDEASVLSTVRLLESAGASAIQLEDQAWPKKCGHMKDKRVIDREDAINKIATAVKAKNNPETLIIARTDAIAPIGIEEALYRANKFVDAGADVIFIDAPQSLDQLERIGREIKIPLLVNMSEGGKTPELSAQEYYELGFKIALFPASSLLAASASIDKQLAELAVSGDTRSNIHNMFSLDELNELVQLDLFDNLGRLINT